MFAELGATVTDATGTVASTTETEAVPLLPSLMAVIVAEPAAAPVTSPLALTSATLISLDIQVMARPVSTPPAESVVVADNCTVAPTRTVSNRGVTETEATASSELSKRVGSSHAAKSASVARTTCGHVIGKRIHWAGYPDGTLPGCDWAHVSGGQETGNALNGTKPTPSSSSES
jgi:hypothetical protein